MQPLQQGPQRQDEHRRHNQFGAIGGPDRLGIAGTQQVHHPAHVPDQPDLHRCHQHRRHGGNDKHPAERPGIQGQKRPQALRWRIRLLIRCIRIDQIFKIAEQGGGLSRRCSSAIAGIFAGENPGLHYSRAKTTAPNATIAPITMLNKRSRVPDPSHPAMACPAQAQPNAELKAMARKLAAMRDAVT